MVDKHSVNFETVSEHDVCRLNASGHVGRRILKRIAGCDECNTNTRQKEPPKRNCTIEGLLQRRAVILIETRDKIIAKTWLPLLGSPACLY